MRRQPAEQDATNSYQRYTYIQKLYPLFNGTACNLRLHIYIYVLKQTGQHVAGSCRTHNLNDLNTALEGHTPGEAKRYHTLAFSSPSLYLDFSYGVHLCCRVWNLCWLKDKHRSMQPSLNRPTSSEDETDQRTWMGVSLKSKPYTVL